MNESRISAKIRSICCAAVRGDLIVVVGRRERTCGATGMR